MISSSRGSLPRRLGLAIVRSIIESHRGLIQIESRVGRGTLVRITLPIAAQSG